MKYTVSNKDDMLDTDLLQLIETGCDIADVPVDHAELTYPALRTGKVIVARNYGDPAGFLFFVGAVHPHTHRKTVVEQLLFVHQKYRSSSYNVADGLLQMLETEARRQGAQDICAGSSLSNNEQARTIYERAGFKTNYSFKKDITNV